MENLEILNLVFSGGILLLLIIVITWMVAKW